MSGILDKVPNQQPICVLVLLEDDAYTPDHSDPMATMVDPELTPDELLDVSGFVGGLIEYTFANLPYCILSTCYCGVFDLAFEMFL